AATWGSSAFARRSGIRFCAGEGGIGSSLFPPFPDSFPPGTSSIRQSCRTTSLSGRDRLLGRGPFARRLLPTMQDTGRNNSWRRCPPRGFDVGGGDQGFPPGKGSAEAKPIKLHDAAVVY